MGEKFEKTYICIYIDYIVLSLDFQQMGTDDFANSSTFVHAFMKKMLVAFRKVEAEDKETLEEMLSEFRNGVPDARMGDLFECLR